MSEEIRQRSYGDMSEMPTIKDANKPHMAFLFLVDTSSSMEGEPIRELNDGINYFRMAANEDKETRDIADVAIVEFNSGVNVVQPFDSVTEMQEVNLSATGMTSMVSGLRTALEMVDTRYRLYKATGTQPYLPWIVMITDGMPTDDQNGAMDEVREELRRLDKEDKVRLWVLAVKGANLNYLYTLCNEKRLVYIKDYDFKKFFDWANKSKRAISVSSPGESYQMQELPENVKIVTEEIAKNETPPADWA